VLATDDGSPNMSASETITVTVNKLASYTSIISHNPDPSAVEQAVTVEYSVAAAEALSGNVTVSDGTDSCTASVNQGSCSITFTTDGPKYLRAVYSGDDTHATSMSDQVEHMVIVIPKVPTQTLMVSHNPNPSKIGEPVEVYFAVMADGDTTGGKVTVSDGTDSCTAAADAGVCSITFTTPGHRSLKATYSGDYRTEMSASAEEDHEVICAYSLSSAYLRVSGSSHIGSLTVTAYEACPSWYANTTDEWIR